MASVRFALGEPSGDHRDHGDQRSGGHSAATLTVTHRGATAPEITFVGRDRELAQLVDAFAVVQSGAAQVVLVTGDPGAGKSALVSQACAQFARQGRVAAGGCVDIPGVDRAQVPFGPFVEALRRLRRSEQNESREALLTAWLNPAAGRDHADQDPVHTRFADLLTLFDRLTEDRPLVLVIEDLHWADQSSLALLVFLARNLTSEPLLLIATTRTHLAPDSVAQATLDHVQRLPLASTVAMEPMPDDDIATLVLQYAPQPLSALESEAIVLRAEGNPLAARELASNPPANSTAPDGTWVPATLAISVRDRVRRTSPPARAVLAAAAVLGGTADAAVVDHMLTAALPGLDHDQHLTAVCEACATGLLLSDGDSYRFRHGLDRDVIYTDLGSVQRRHLHTHAAEAITAQAPIDTPQVVARLAAHWHSAGNHDQTRHYSLIAARASTGFSAFPEALAHYERALTLWTTPISTREESGGPGVDLLLEIAETAALAGRPERSMELARVAASAATTVEQTQQATECLARFSSYAGDFAGAMDSIEQALSAQDNDEASTVSASMLATYSRSLMMVGRYAESADQARAALGAVTNEADPAKSSALITLGIAVAVIINPDEGLSLLRQGRAHSQAHGHVAEFWRAQVNLGYVLNTLGRYQDAADTVLETLATTPASIQDPGIVLALPNTAVSLIMLGQWHLADSILAEGLAQRPPPSEASWLVIQQAQLRLLIGDADAAQALLSKARTCAADVTDPEAIAHLCQLSAELALHRGDWVAARVAVDEALAALAPMAENPQVLFPVLAVAARIEAEIGDVATRGKPARLAPLHDMLSAGVALLNDDQLHAHLEATFCAADLARAGGTDDQQMWRAAADRAGDLKSPYLRAYALLHLASAAVRAKNRRAARPALAEAHRIAADLGAAPLTQQIEQTARRLRIPMNGLKSKTAALGLTDREVEVLRLLVEGQTNRQISSRLSMAEKTASVHVSRILAKLGCATRGAAAAAAQRLQLLDD